jgi:hypothetical protein
MLMRNTNLNKRNYIMNFEKYLDENGFEEVAEGMYECPGGHIWSEWMIREDFDEFIEEK